MEREEPPIKVLYRKRLKVSNYTLSDLKHAFVDVLENHSKWEEIRSNTGLPKERCMEIAQVYVEVIKDLYKR